MNVNWVYELSSVDICKGSFKINQSFGDILRIETHISSAKWLIPFRVESQGVGENIDITTAVHWNFSKVSSISQRHK